MTEIVKTRNVLSAYIKEQNRTPYSFKRDCIENSLYGVDIDPGACEIAKLRLWLSLVVDEEDITQIKPLPNLDYKIVCGNSLLGVERDLFNNELFSQLESLKPLYFNETNPTKKQEYKKQIEELISEITNGHKEFDFKVYFSEVFHEKKGFDVVIANPPYVKEYINRKVFDELRDSPYYQGKMDIWYFFACKSVDFLRKEGILTFIAQNNWVTSYGASKMRDKVIKDTKIVQLLDFGPYFVFENSDIQTMIMIFKKDSEIKRYKFDYRSWKDKDAKFEEILDFLNKRQTPKAIYLIPEIKRDKFIGKILTFSKSEVEKILEKIPQQGNFKLNNKEVAQGIVVPQNFLSKNNREKLGKGYKVGQGIFVLSDKEKKEINFNERELEIIKPYYTSDELKRNYANPKNRYWIIYSKSDMNKKINKYPNIKRHLDKFKDIITSDFGPYGLHRARNEKFFNGEKIVSLRKCLKPTFTYTNFDCYVSQTFFIIKTERIDLKYLTVILNSKVVKFWLYHKGKRQGDLYQIDKEPLLNIPIPPITPENQQIAGQMESFVDKILSFTQSEDYLENLQKQVKVKEYERQIDEMVYELYDLGQKEIVIIETFSRR